MQRKIIILTFSLLLLPNIGTQSNSRLLSDANNWPHDERRLSFTEGSVSGTNDQDMSNTTGPNGETDGTGGSSSEEDDVGGGTGDDGTTGDGTGGDGTTYKYSANSYECAFAEEASPCNLGEDHKCWGDRYCLVAEGQLTGECAGTSSCEGKAV